MPFKHMAGYNTGRIKEVLHIPDEYSVVCLISLGYEGPPSNLDPENGPKTNDPEPERTFPRWSRLIV